MNSDWNRPLTRWADAGLIDADTAARIRAFELGRATSSRLGWPIRIALAFGALMLAGGVLLFVAANWDALSPIERFALVLALVSAFHIAGAFAADRFSAMAVALHAIGTITLGAGIALAGQIFNLDEHWPGGIMLWAGGAAIAWALLAQTPQMIITAILAPAWLASEWIVANQDLMSTGSTRVLATGVFLLALTYFTSPSPAHPEARRRALMSLGGFALVPAALQLAAVSLYQGWSTQSVPLASIGLRIVGWSVAIGLPLMLAIWLRRAAAWPNAVAALWTGVLFWLHPDSSSSTLPLYAWWALGGIGLLAWGVQDHQTERVNAGAVVFAATVVAFYFSQVMDKLGRSASLLGLGLLFLAGGWALERARRRFVMQARGSA